VERWDQNESYGDWLGGCGLDSTGSGQGPLAGCCECGDEPSGSCATELVIFCAFHAIHLTVFLSVLFLLNTISLPFVTYIFYIILLRCFLFGCNWPCLSVVKHVNK
jgi:hypothetical protein